MTLNTLPFIAFDEMVQKYLEQELHHKELLQKLISSNQMLQQNNNITHSIGQITSKILFSGDINATLQTILDKAIELIPNAQKGRYSSITAA